MAQGFLTGVDIANRGLQHIGARRIITFADATRNAAECNALYDKIRRRELRRSVWNFSTRRCVLRPFTPTSFVVLPALWLVGTTYAFGAGVVDPAGQVWISRLSGNVGNSPVEGLWWTAYTGPIVADNWSFTVQYYAGDLAYVAPVPYLCILQHINHMPPNATYWVPFTPSPFSSPQVSLPFPLGLSPDLSSIRTIYRLPYGYLRVAPQDQKRPDRPRLSVSAAMRYQDWEIEGSFLFSATDNTGPFNFRYVADVTDVTQMDDLFCEAVAASIGMELCEILTQNRDKLAAANAAYDRSIQLAKDINAIEGGSTENEENPDVKPAPVPQNQPAR